MDDRKEDQQRAFVVFSLPSALWPACLSTLHRSTAGTSFSVYALTGTRQHRIGRQRRRDWRDWPRGDWPRQGRDRGRAGRDRGEVAQRGRLPPRSRGAVDPAPRGRNGRSLSRFSKYRELCCSVLESARYENCCPPSSCATSRTRSPFAAMTNRPSSSDMV